METFNKIKTAKVVSFAAKKEEKRKQEEAKIVERIIEASKNLSW